MTELLNLARGHTATGSRSFPRGTIHIRGVMTAGHQLPKTSHLSATSPSSVEASVTIGGTTSRESKSTEPTPSNSFFGVVEICEQILQHLPSNELLRARRISRAFRDTIDDSPSLGKKLFLHACPDAGTRPWVIDATIGTLKPLMDEQATGAPTIRETPRSTAFHVKPTLANHFLFTPHRLPGGLFPDAKMSAKYHDSQVRFLHDIFCSLNHSLLPGDALAYRMFLSHPPVTNIRVVCSEMQGSSSGSRQSSVKKIEDKDGVRLGDIKDHLPTVKRQQGNDMHIVQLYFYDLFSVSDKELRQVEAVVQGLSSQKILW